MTEFYVIMNAAGEYLYLATEDDGRPEYRYGPIHMGPAMMEINHPDAPLAMDYFRRTANEHNGKIRRITVTVHPED